MYEDNESIKVFERQHARDRLAELAHDLSDQPGTDFVSAHFASKQAEGRLFGTIALAALAVLVIGTVLGIL